MSEPLILIIEDDERIASSLVRALEGTGYSTRWEPNGLDGIEAATSDCPGLVLLDLGLPDVDGAEVCRQIHSGRPELAIIILTARDEEIDVVVGLDAGAVDYVTKPFKLAELLARIRAQLRRAENQPPNRPSPAGVTIERGPRRVWVDETEADLRPKEFDLLLRLVDDVGNVVDRETLMHDVWDENWFGSTKTLDFHIAALRRKIERPNGGGRITTIRGVGFRLECQ